MIRLYCYDSKRGAGTWLDAGELAAIQGERDSVEGEKKAAKEFITRLAVSYIVQHQSGV